jgi:HD-GYP domain-containing protein (c-di-GMP phosphodiesterase class II)
VDVQAPTGGAAIARVHLIGALSRALDVTEGQPLGHSVRSCWLGMRLAQAAGWPEREDDRAFYAVLLKDAGCSANAAHVSALFGTDDIAAKGDLKWRNWTRYRDAARYAWSQVLPGAPLAARLRRLAQVAVRGPRAQRDMVSVRCHRGAEVLRQLGWADVAPEVVFHLDEHWDGGGLPDGLRHDAIPRGSRLALLAQQVEIFHARFGPEAALDMVRRLRGRWFDPELCDVMLRLGQDPALWQGLRAAADPSALESLDPKPMTLQLDGSRQLDVVARTFAEVVDHKSAWTARHSVRTAAYAAAVARFMGYGADRVRRVEMAAFYHDLGKLGVSNLVLDKPGPLDATERRAIERHVALTRLILEPVRPLADVAAAAAAHHERLDGSGYDQGLRGEAIPPDALIVAVSDVFDALTAARPYRGPLDPEQALAVLRREAGGRLPASVVEAVGEALRAGRLPMAAAPAPR